MSSNQILRLICEGAQTSNPHAPFCFEVDLSTSNYISSPLTDFDISNLCPICTGMSTVPSNLMYDIPQLKDDVDLLKQEMAAKSPTITAVEDMVMNLQSDLANLRTDLVNAQKPKNIVQLAGEDVEVAPLDKLEALEAIVRILFDNLYPGKGPADISTVGQVNLIDMKTKLENLGTQVAKADNTARIDVLKSDIKQLRASVLNLTEVSDPELLVQTIRQVSTINDAILNGQFEFDPEVRF